MSGPAGEADIQIWKAGVSDVRSDAGVFAMVEENMQRMLRTAARINRGPERRILKAKRNAASGPFHKSQSTFDWR
jgi:hypothetical protein